MTNILEGKGEREGFDLPSESKQTNANRCRTQKTGETFFSFSPSQVLKPVGTAASKILEAGPDARKRARRCVAVEN